jgi:hypothetical protein
MPLSCYNTTMITRSLIQTNPYLRDPDKRRAMFYMTVCTSTGVEGVHLTSTEIEKDSPQATRFTSVRVTAVSSRSPR